MSKQIFTFYSYSISRIFPGSRGVFISWFILPLSNFNTFTKLLCIWCEFCQQRNYELSVFIFLQCKKLDLSEATPLYLQVCKNFFTLKFEQIFYKIVFHLFIKFVLVWLDFETFSNIIFVCKMNEMWIYINGDLKLLAQFVRISLVLFLLIIFSKNLNYLDGSVELYLHHTEGGWNTRERSTVRTRTS